MEKREYLLALCVNLDWTLPLSFAFQHYHVELISNNEIPGEESYSVFLDYYFSPDCSHYHTLKVIDCCEYDEALVWFRRFFKEAASLENMNNWKQIGLDPRDLGERSV